MHRAAVRADGGRVYDRPAGAAVRQGGEPGREAVDGVYHADCVKSARDEGGADAGLMKLEKNKGRNLGGGGRGGGTRNGRP